MIFEEFCERYERPEERGPCELEEVEGERGRIQGDAREVVEGEEDYEHVCHREYQRYRRRLPPVHRPATALPASTSRLLRMRFAFGFNLAEACFSRKHDELHPLSC